ncbi:glycosyltransferase family 2 protein [Cryomorphaceae bacterium 1068]|nr:glycosyltransferase family 2 protein [Cryomorphaceae bacterium 1068]
MKTAIVILNYNGEAHLRRFLPSVVEHNPKDVEIVVADNASTDGSADFLRSEYPTIQLIQLPTNYGFAGGYNEALKQVSADIYVLLNSDVEVTSGWLHPLLTEMKDRPEVTACQPKIRAVENRKYFEYAGASGGFLDKNGYPFCRGRIFDNTERDIGQHDDEREVFWASGACILIRSESFHEAEGFDETLFAHMEEIDLCWRLKNQGHRIYCFPQSTVYHLGGGTLSSTNPRKTYLNFRNNLSIIVKNDYKGSLFQKLLKRMIFDGAAAGYMLITSGPKHSFAVLRAHSFFYSNLSRLLKERKYWREKSHDINRTGLYKGSIVQDYFKDKKKVFGSLATNLFVRQNRNA